MNRTIKNAVVLGAGIMGSGIACHLANIGVQVLLLDVVPEALTKDEREKGFDLRSPQVRSRKVNKALATALGSKPDPLYERSFAAHITTGNFEDDLFRIAEADWIIEAVTEQLEVKKHIFDQVEKYRKPGTLVTTNTSGIPIHLMNENRSGDFQEHFCGTHFFNPPRYARLLEIIPGPKTRPSVMDFIAHYGELNLGKETVYCKNTPAFIANRIGTYAMMLTLRTLEDMGLTVGEADDLTGPVIGRPKSATFRTLDVIGLDTLVNVAGHLYAGLPHDRFREMFKLPDNIRKVYERGWLGDKSKQGYYKKTRDEDGRRLILELDLQTFEYGRRTRAGFQALEAVKDEIDLKARIKTLLSFNDKAGTFYRTVFFDMFRYVSYRIPEISDEIYRIDQAVCAGFGWEIGPFNTWDVLGVRKTVEEMEAMGLKPAPWVYDLLEAGHDTFYRIENGSRKYYDSAAKAYKVIPGRDGLIILDHIRETQKLWSNTGASIFHIGDEVLCLEFHTKMNAMGIEVVEGIETAIAMAENHYKGLVIGNEGPNFSAGIDLAVLYALVRDRAYHKIDSMIVRFQHTVKRARFSSVPVVSAPAGMTLGGGCELSLHCDAVQAHAETYMGLVEVGAGLIPGGGGTKELTLRASDAYRKGDPELNRLQEAFMTIATARVSGSAAEAQKMGMLRTGDAITLNRSRLIAEARQKVIGRYEAGYTQPVERKDIKVHGRTGLALFEAGINGMQFGNYISEHDATVARKVAHVMCGGDLTSPQEVSEQYLLDLEREAFLSLTSEPKTLERIHHILFKGKPSGN